MAGVGDAGNLWGATTPRPVAEVVGTADAIGRALLAVAQPDLFGHVVDAATANRLDALRQRRRRTARRRAAERLLAEPWAIGETDAAPDAVTLARRFLRRHPERDRADPEPLLTARQEAALWHFDEEAAEDWFRRDAS
jgi:hypothetical protein